MMLANLQAMGSCPGESVDLRSSSPETPPQTMDDRVGRPRLSSLASLQANLGLSTPVLGDLIPARCAPERRMHPA